MGGHRKLDNCKRFLNNDKSQIENSTQCLGGVSPSLGLWLAAAILAARVNGTRSLLRWETAEHAYTGTWKSLAAAQIPFTASEDVWSDSAAKL